MGGDPDNVAAVRDEAVVEDVEEVVEVLIKDDPEVDVGEEQKSC